MTTTQSESQPGVGPRPSAESPFAPQRQVVISDPQAVRALAHSARIDVLDELYASGRARTATELAARSDLTPSAMSYHLRALEKYGLVERAASEGDARERRWRATGDQLVVSPIGGSPAGQAAYTDMQLAQLREHLMEEIAYRHEVRSHGEPGPEHPFSAYGSLFLDEALEREFSERVFDLVREFEARATELDEDCAEVRRVVYEMAVLPDRSRERAARGGTDVVGAS